MKRPIQLLLVCVAAPAPWSAAAAPPNRGHIPADPAWVLHLDCDALRETYIGKYLLYQMYKPEMRSNMLAFRDVLSFDLRTQLHGVTIYNDGATPRDAVVIVYADFNPDRIITLLKSTQAAEVITNNNHLIYTWSDQKNNDGTRSYADIQSGFMVVGKDKERLCAALAVMDGTAPNLSAGKALPELDAAGNDTFVQGTARRLDFLGANPNANAALLKQSRRVQLRATEVNEKLDAVLTVETGNEATAKQMSIVGQGLIALLSLQKDHPKVAKLADGMSVKQEGGTLIVSFAVPSADLIAALKAYTAKKEKPPGETK